MSKRMIKARKVKKSELIPSQKGRASNVRTLDIKKLHPRTKARGSRLFEVSTFYPTLMISNIDELHEFWGREEDMEEMRIGG